MSLGLITGSTDPEGRAALSTGEHQGQDPVSSCQLPTQEGAGSTCPDGSPPTDSEKTSSEEEQVGRLQGGPVPPSRVGTGGTTAGTRFPIQGRN